MRGVVDDRRDGCAGVAVQPGDADAVVDRPVPVVRDADASARHVRPPVDGQRRASRSRGRWSRARALAHADRAAPASCSATIVMYGSIASSPSNIQPAPVSSPVTGAEWLWVAVTRTAVAGMPIASPIAVRIAAACASVIRHRSSSATATVVVPSVTTRTVAVRSMSLPSDRSWSALLQPPIGNPTGGVMSARPVPARSRGVVTSSSPDQRHAAGHPAVDVDRLAGDEPGLVARQEPDRGGDVLRAPFRPTGVRLMYQASSQPRSS